MPVLSTLDSCTCSDAVGKHSVVHVANAAAEIQLCQKTLEARPYNIKRPCILLCSVSGQRGRARHYS
jgi:hypothetical protein